MNVDFAAIVAIPAARIGFLLDFFANSFMRFIVPMSRYSCGLWLVFDTRQDAAVSNLRRSWW
jgi:hypothetical protein